MAAFALGLVGDPSAETSLAPLLTDTVPLVRGRAAEALGLIGAKASAAGDWPDGGGVREERGGVVDGTRSRSGADRPGSRGVQARALRARAARRLRTDRGGGAERRSARQPVVARRLRASARGRQTRGAGAAEAARHRHAIHARVRGTRPRPIEGSRGCQAPARAAPAVSQGGPGSDRRGNPRARAARRDRRDPRADADRRRSRGASQRSPRGRHGAG